MVQKVGIDVGFGYSKLCRWDPEAGKFRSLVIPSVFGRSARVQQMDLGLGGPSRRRVFRLGYQGEEYLMGADALLHSALGVSARTDFGRIGSDEERVLMLALLAKAGLTDVAIMTGVPVLAWGLRRNLRKSWEGGHQVRLGRKEMTIRVREVRIAWQPVLSLYYLALEVDEKGQVGLAPGMTEERLRKGWLVVDIGHHTFDLAGVVNLAPVEKYSGGELLGGKDLLKVIQQAIVDQYGVHRQLADLEAALRKGTLDLYDETIDLLPLAQSAGGGLATQIITGMGTVMGDGSQFHGVILTGGPAPVLHPAVAKAWPKNQVYCLDQMANARGASKFCLGPGVFKTEKEW